MVQVLQVAYRDVVQQCSDRCFAGSKFGQVGGVRVTATINLPKSKPGKVVVEVALNGTGCMPKVISPILLPRLCAPLLIVSLAADY